MISETLVLFRREVVKWLRRKPVLVMSLSTPVFWIALFGKSFNIINILNAVGIGVDPALLQQLRAVLEKSVLTLFGTSDYFTYVATGMLAVFALFQSMFGAVGVVFERRIGYLTRLLVAPISRASIFLSKVLGALFRISVLAFILLAIAGIMGLKLKPGIGPWEFIASWLVLMLVGFGLSSLFTGLAFNVSHQEVLFALANLVNLPLMFSSSALFPPEQMPAWLKGVAIVNPISHAADLIRYYLVGKPLESPELSLAYLVLLTMVLSAMGYALALRGMRKV